MSAKKIEPQQVIGMTTYPVMMVAVDGDGPDYLIKCSCGEKFVVDGIDGDNLIPVNGILKECCPKCFGMPGMTAQDHANSLTEIQLMLCGVRFGFMPKATATAGWLHAQESWINELLENAGKYLAGGKPAPMKTENLPARLTWQDRGPFPINPKKEIPHEGSI